MAEHKPIRPIFHVDKLGLMCLALTLFAGVSRAAPAANKEIKPLFDVKIDHELPNPRETFDEVLKLVQQNYYTDQVDDKSLWWGAIQGLLRQLSPEENKGLAAIWLPEEYDRVNQSLHGVSESIGVKSSYTPADGSLTVTEVIPGGPSETLLQPYDRIVRIDGQTLKNLPVAEIDGMLKGEAGSKVGLKVVRDVAVFDLVVTRAKVQMPNVEVQELPDGIRLVAISQFNEGTSTELKDIFDAAVKAGCKGVILDLRGNSGGVFSEGLKCSELFIPKGQSLMRIVTHGSQVNNYVSTNEAPFTLPLAIMVNGSSASASEILAAALRDELAAPLVGEKTFGKATMEKIYPLQNKYRVKFTYAALYSPKGKSWQKLGLVPDVVVDEDDAIPGKTRKLAPDQRLSLDKQLRAAYELLTRSIRLTTAPAPAEK
ncbi:MAG: hypothetical protein A3K19_24480 [Lentisphaerae bacterium RIFOXYB12_FULL_65_16]|nr:MAG: hypothetical protein A3K18_18190 [Lentisphaerae bacterium RIFOXYA12_64_32]OGV88541.1 MAG: hypothetical protein A3K19_24480 [Lentisphaerae bacterium RIFOXYB12_FULL_65_16]